MREIKAKSNDLSDEAIYMIAAETTISAVFEQADDDTQYHHNVINCKKIPADSKDVAESILGWTLVL